MYTCTHTKIQLVCTYCVWECTTGCAGCVCVSVFSPGFCEVLSADQFRVASSACVYSLYCECVCVCLCACACTCAYMHVCMYVVCSMYVHNYVSVSLHHVLVSVCPSCFSTRSSNSLVINLIINFYHYSEGSRVVQW